MSAKTMTLPAVERHIEILTKQKAAVEYGIKCRTEKLTELEAEISKYEAIREEKGTNKWKRSA